MDQLLVSLFVLLLLQEKKLYIKEEKKTGIRNDLFCNIILHLLDSRFYSLIFLQLVQVQLNTYLIFKSKV